MDELNYDISAEYSAYKGEIACKVQIGKSTYFAALASVKNYNQAEQIAKSMQEAYDRVLWDEHIKDGYFLKGECG